MNKIKKHGTLNHQQIKILKNLVKDKPICITKADKDWCTVVLDRAQYIDSMESLYNEFTSFKLVDMNPTVIQEDRLTRKLREVKSVQFHISTRIHLLLCCWISTSSNVWSYETTQREAFL